MADPTKPVKAPTQQPAPRPPRLSSKQIRGAAGMPARMAKQRRVFKMGR